MDEDELAYDCLFGGWNGPAIGLLDLDAFFASVEQLDHPEWRGRPVIVGGPPEERGVVSTASYEARKWGVRSAMPSAQATRLCPDAVWCRGNFPRYREMSRKVMDIIADETPYLEQVSIDEAFFDVTPGRFSRENPVEIARRISGRVSGLGISCSIGMGSSKTVAKIASELDKPGGLTVVPPGTESGFLEDLPVRSMSGIGSAAEASLLRSGIRTLGQLSRAPLALIEPIFGANAEVMRSRAAGRERDRVASIDERRAPKSVSNERTFARDLTERPDIVAAIELLGESVGRRLRRKGLVGRTVALKLRYSYGRGRSAQRRLSHPTDDENIFVPAALEMLDGIWSPGMHVRLAGIGMSDFEGAGGIQTDLFCELDERGAASSSRRELSVAMDRLRDRFGDSVVEFGRTARFGGTIARRPPE